jgi:nitrogen fixation protein NifU and related proteins
MDIYREDILDHYEKPRNMGEVDDPTLAGKDSNASCGDMIQFQLEIKDGMIKEAKWRGIGCAITTASASKLSEWLQGQTLKDLKEMSEEEMVKKGIGFEVNFGRAKCLTLPVRVVKKLVCET